MAALIASAEVVPLMVMASKSSTFSAMTSNLGRAFATNSGRQMAINGTSNVLEQYTSHAMAYGEFGKSNFRKIDLWDVASSALFSKWGAVPVKSAIDFDLKNGFQFNPLDQFAEKVFASSLKYKASNSFGKAIGEPIGDFIPTYGGVLDQGGKLVIKTTIETFNEKSKEN